MGFKLHKSYTLSTNQQVIKEVAAFLKDNNLDNKPFYCNAYYLPMLLEKRVDMKTECRSLANLYNVKPTHGELLIWDSYFAVSDAEVTDTFIEQNFNSRLIKSFKNQDDPKKYTIKIYEVLTELKP